MAGVWREGGGSGWGCPPFPAPISPHLGSCVPDRTMASAATEAEKGSPVVVGLLVVGNFIILVRPPPVLGAQWVGGEEGTAQAWGGVLRAQDPPPLPNPRLHGQCCRLSNQSSLDSYPSSAASQLCMREPATLLCAPSPSIQIMSSSEGCCVA